MSTAIPKIEIGSDTFATKYRGSPAIALRAHTLGAAGTRVPGCYMDSVALMKEQLHDYQWKWLLMAMERLREKRRGEVRFLKWWVKKVNGIVKEQTREP